MLMNIVNRLGMATTEGQNKAPFALGMRYQEELNDTTLLFLQITCIVEIVLMTVLMLVSTSFLINAYRSKHKPASFIIKLMILVDCVAVSGLGAAMNEAPFLRKFQYVDTSMAIVLQGLFEFVYWVAAQWSTWIIAFQFYSTAKQMKKVDAYFNKKVERRRNMTQQEIKEEKEKKKAFLKRQKNKLFGLIDKLDTLEKVTDSVTDTVTAVTGSVTETLHLSEKKTEDDQKPAQSPQQQMPESGVQMDVSVYRRRLNRWKNCGVWVVLLSVSMAVLSIEIIKYNVVIKGVSREDDDLHVWLLIGIIFGGVNIVCQVIACAIMASATINMKKLVAKNGLDNYQFDDIKMNNYVSLLICLGYSIDYAADVTVTLLFLNKRLDFDQEAYMININSLSLAVCIFAAYIILMKVFLNYHKQMHEAQEKIEAAQEKALLKAKKKEAQKLEQQALAGETGVTPIHKTSEEPLLNRKSGMSVNDGDNSDEEEEDADPESFVTNVLGSKGVAEAIAKKQSITQAEEVSDSDSFGSDSSCDSILDESDDELDANDKALQSQILSNFVAMHKKGNGRSFLLRQETRTMDQFSPNNAQGSFKKKPKQTKVITEEIEIDSETESEVSDNDISPRGVTRLSYRPETKVIDYDDIELW